MSALRILHVETGKHLYGGALQVLYLVDGLTRRGCINHVVCPRGSALPGALGDTVERIHEMDISGDLDLRFAWQLRRLLLELRPDVLHLHSRRGADVLGGVAGLGTGVPVVLSRRVDNPEPAFWARIKYRLYDAVVTISEGIRQVLLAEGVPEERVRCVPSAVDTQRFRPGGDRAWFVKTFGGELDVSPDDPIVGTVAQLIPRKGHRHLLEAVPRVLETVPRARFFLFGRGPLEREIGAEIERRRLGRSIRIAGFTEEIERVLPCLDALVHPADMEGLGVALLQAAACEVPLVATAAGGIPEIVRDGVNGVLVPRGDVEGLARGLALLLGDPEKTRAFGREGRKLVQRHFSIDAMVDGNLQVYRSVIGLQTR